MLDEPGSIPRRPLAAVACALLCGAWAGKLLAPDGRTAALALATIAGAWFALRWAARHAERRELSAGAATLLLLAALAAIRAAPAADSGAALEGCFEPVRRTERGVLGRLDGERGARAWLELPRGSVDAGEWIRVAPVETPTHSASGPVPAPHAPGAGEPPRSWSVLADEVVRLAPAPPWEEGFGLLRRARAELLLRCRMFEAGAPRDLARALLVGDTAGLDPELAELFTRTGLRHVLSVSGMHVSLLAALALAPFARRGASRSSRTWIVLVAALALAAYVGVTGSQAPVRRAAIALALTLAAPRLRSPASGRVDTLSLLLLALVLEIALDTRVVFNLSFSLSYAATLGLIVGTRPVARALLARMQRLRAPRLGPTRLRDALWALGARSTSTALGASIAAVLATLPLVWSAFGEWAPLGVLATPLATPLVAWLLGYGWLALAWPDVVPVAGFEAPARWLVELLRSVDTWPGTPSVLPPRPFALTAGAVVLAALASASARVPWRAWRGTLGRCAALAGACALVPWSIAPRALELVALDVGHGTCVVLRSPELGTWVFDAGSRDRSRVAQAALAPLLAAWEVERLSIALSHADRDHCGALPWIVERYPVERWLGALPAPLDERLAHTCERLDVGSGSLRLASPTGVRIEWVRGLEQPGNEGSRALCLRRSAGDVWLFGDASADGLAALLAEGLPERPVELVLWPHHGDDSPWSSALLERAPGARVWLSAGATAPIEAELLRRGVLFRSTHAAGWLALRLALERDAGGTEVAAAAPD